MRESGRSMNDTSGGGHQEDVARMDSPHDSEDARTAPAVAPNAHTPGPWRAALTDDKGPREGEFELACLEHHIFGTNIYAPGEYYSDNLAEHEANARLIAAAPDLLDALKVILELASDVLSNPKYDGIVSDARYAIAKAEGR